MDDSTSPNPQSPGLQKRYATALSKIEQYKRTAYRPHTRKVKPVHDATSKIGGLPYLRSPTDWPVCPNCNHHLQLFLQLNSRIIPIDTWEGLIQLFYCTNDETGCESRLEAFFPFSKAVVCRKIEAGGKSSSQTPKISKLFAEKRIIGWETKADYPHYEEWDHLGIDLEIDDETYELMHKTGAGVPLSGDKLFGWPFWVQSIEYPVDRQTGALMNLLFQFDSQMQLPWMFGDAGIGHLTISPDNAAELGFGWACT